MGKQIQTHVYTHSICHSTGHQLASIGPPAKLGPNWAPTGHTAWKSRIVFLFLNGWGKKGRLFYDTWKLHEIQNRVFINKVLQKHSYIHSFTCCLLLFLSAIAQYVSEIVWITEIELFTTMAIYWSLWTHSLRSVFMNIEHYSIRSITLGFYIFGINILKGY